MKVNLLAKPVWKTSSEVKLCSFVVRNKDLGNIRAKILDLLDCHYATKLYAENGTELGKDFFGLMPDENRMYDFSMETAKDYREKFRLGELMRLVSIMEMFENRIKTMELFSRSTALYFHAKYGFKANIKQFIHRDKTLNSIAEDMQQENLAAKAKFLIKQVQGARTGEELRNLCKITSKLADEYLEKTKGERMPLEHGFDMIITREDILREKDYFNELFKNHGIDYKI